MNDTTTSVLDDLSSPSITKKEPEYSLTNVFKPTPKNKIIIGMMIKVISIGLVGLGTTLFGLMALIPDLVKTLLISGVVLNMIGLVGGAIGESIILFTKEEPLSSLVRAAEDIKLDVVKSIETQEAQPLTNPTPND